MGILESLRSVEGRRSGFAGLELQGSYAGAHDRLQHACSWASQRPCFRMAEEDDPMVKRKSRKTRKAARKLAQPRRAKAKNASARRTATPKVRPGFISHTEL